MPALVPSSTTPASQRYLYRSPPPSYSNRSTVSSNRLHQTISQIVTIPPSQTPAPTITPTPPMYLPSLPIYTPAPPHPAPAPQTPCSSSFTSSPPSQRRTISAIGPTFPRSTLPPAYLAAVNKQSQGVTPRNGDRDYYHGAF